MPVLDLHHDEWTRYRCRLEREARVLIIDSDSVSRKEQENLLYRFRISGRGVSRVEQGLEQVGRGHYNLVLVADEPQGGGSLNVGRRVREQSPETDVIVTSRTPTIQLVLQAFGAHAIDVLTCPISAEEDAGGRLWAAVRHNVDRRMRAHLLEQLKQLFETLSQEQRAQATGLLEMRLSLQKEHLVRYSRVLISEGEDPALRFLSETLHLARLQVECAPDIEAALQRAGRCDVRLLVLDGGEDTSTSGQVVSAAREAAPRADVVLLARNPDVAGAMLALRAGAKFYEPWPTASHSLLADRLQAMLRASRQRRLQENLLLELYAVVASGLSASEAGGSLNEAAETEAGEDLSIFLALVGLSEGPRLERQHAGEEGTVDNAAVFLDDILQYLEEDDSPQGAPNGDAALGADDSGADRRLHQRVAESQFLRFRTPDEPVCVLALLGDVSEGGLFVRTPEPLPRGRHVEVEFTLDHAGGTYLIRCLARVAWSARLGTTNPMGPGFGVEFVEPPPDVPSLLKAFVSARSVKLPGLR